MSPISTTKTAATSLLRRIDVAGACGRRWAASWGAIGPMSVIELSRWLRSRAVVGVDER
jgi:hypothetical protein